MAPLEGIDVAAIEDAIDKAQSLLNAGKAEKALELLENLGDAGMASAAVRNTTGICLVMMGRVAEAEEQFRAAISINNEYSAAYTNLGNVYREKGDRTKAVEYYERAVQADPTYSNAYHNLGALYISEKNYDKGIPLMKTAKQLELGKGDIKKGKRKQFLWRYSWVAIAFIIGAALIYLNKQK